MSNFPKLEEIKRFRVDLGITQKELAKAVGVSTNMITQIETGRTKPSADKYVKIFDYLFIKSDQRETKLEEIWSRPIISIKPTQTVKVAKKKLDDEKLDIDCLPVIDKEGRLQGKITKKGLDDLFKKTRRKPDSIIIKDVLEESPPTAPHDTPKEWVKDFFQIQNNCVLVTKDGKIKGIVNYWDYLSK